MFGRFRQNEAGPRAEMASRWLVLCICIVGPQVFGLDCFTTPGSALRGPVSVAESGLRKGFRLVGGGLRLRGGVDKDEEDSEEEQKWKGPAVKLSAAAEAAAKAKSAESKPAEETQASKQESAPELANTEGSETKEDVEMKQEEGEAAVHREAFVVPPEMVQLQNQRLWEAALDGNEPQVEKAIKNGANVNAFCRGPDKWLNITVGAIAGADEASTGLNVHWMELNNYTAMHLAAASGNAAIIDRLIQAGADINVECLQRINPMPTAFGMNIPFLSVGTPIIYKCTPLRLARAANCGKCFFTSFQKSVNKLVKAKAIDRDWHFPLNTVLLGLTFLGAYLGINKWPFAWFKEWPENWQDYPDMASYLPQR